jgi:hypothetical protein
VEPLDRIIIVKEIKPFFRKKYTEVTIDKFYKFVPIEADGTPIYNGETNAIYEREYSTRLEFSSRGDGRLFRYSSPINSASAAIIRIKYGLEIPSPIYGYVSSHIENAPEPAIKTAQPVIIKNVNLNMKRWDVIEL